MPFVTVAACTLPSMVLDFEGNRDRILESIRIAKSGGATIRTGPELELCGYGCQDFFKNPDTVMHCWEMLEQIISNKICKDMLIDVGLPVRHRNITYNCRILFSHNILYAIVPKQDMANDLIYRELRWFTPWPATKRRIVEPYYLEEGIYNITKQRTVPFGDLILSTLDTAVACETCESLFTPLNPSSYYGLNGAEIILNSSASHAELRKLDQRISLIANCTRKLGGIYVYSNCVGVDGDPRYMFDGASNIFLNGQIMTQGEQFGFKDVEVTCATVDLEAVRTFRNSSSRAIQGSNEADFPRVEVNLRLSVDVYEIYLSDSLKPSRPLEPIILDPMTEMWKAESLYLWNYLVRSRAGGFFLALSGGLDSCATALFVYGMAVRLIGELESGNQQALAQLQEVTNDSKFHPHKPQEIVNRLLHTCYMGTHHSSLETQNRASDLAKSIGAHHTTADMTSTVQAMENLGTKTNEFTPSFDGERDESLAKENVQARLRMVFSYLLAQTSTRARSLKVAGRGLLTLSSANVDEQLRGYVTKYDCSSADIAPLGTISKVDARKFVAWANTKWDMTFLSDFLDATPTAELKPPGKEGEAQSDEADDEMGFTYEDLSTFGKLRKEEDLGPFCTYTRLLAMWKDKKIPLPTAERTAKSDLAATRLIKPSEVAERTIKFWHFHTINRHKSMVMTPSIHLNSYSCDDNRFDMKPALLNTLQFQFKKIRAHAAELEKKMKANQ